MNANTILADTQVYDKKVKNISRRVNAPVNGLDSIFGRGKTRGVIRI